MTHGFGAACLLFYKVIKGLSNNFHLILIDILGLGASSRPPFTISDPEEADLYLVEFIERWRIAMGDIKDFYFFYICRE